MIRAAVTLGRARQRQCALDDPEDITISGMPSLLIEPREMAQDRGDGQIDQPVVEKARRVIRRRPP
jgi:hypothetical protein